ncbi:hypothetical protein DCAR_0313620 [Daucus carota subsp. sativus]|uniref:Uncharacterized protein n=1 Tax=Daucus carota subsp. sativus TaxID=79200 RepID=A0A161Y3M1_DAUCS|nr:hypothetical protein DCAR_0313620 [Daucus carota subsp. sativus]
MASSSCARIVYSILIIISILSLISSNHEDENRKLLTYGKPAASDFPQAGQKESPSPTSTWLQIPGLP